MTRKVLMIACSNAGTTYWRFYNFWVSAHRTGKAWFHVLGWDKKEHGMAPWQYEIADSHNQPKLFGMLYQAGVEADVIIFGRLETEWALTTMYAMRDQFPNKPILAEIDDDITDIAAYNPAAEQLKPGSQQRTIALAQFRNSDGLIVSTPYLKEVYSEYCDNIYVVPNSIDISFWNRAKRKRKPGVRIGWIGANSHQQDLELLKDVIPVIIQGNPESRFVITCPQVPAFLKELPGVEVVEKWEEILKYPSYLASLDFDIGLAPLVDNKFNRAKSNLRWLEYSALGIPCVASKVGHFAETVRHGKDGFLASNSGEFIKHIQSLISSVQLRKTIGSAARARIETDFNVDKNVDIYLEAIEDVLKRPIKKAPSLMTGVDDMVAVAEYESKVAEILQ